MSDSLPQSSACAGQTGLGVLFVGHGTRVVAGQLEFRQLFEQFADLISPIPSELSFLELAEPDIGTAVAKLSQRQVSRILVVPVILFTAGHAESDIPNAVHQAVAQHNIQCIGQTQALECSAEVLQLSAERFRQAVCCEKCQQGCSGEFCEKSAWLMIGRGSSSSEATEKTREFCRLRRQLTPTMSAEVAFIHGQTPSVPKALDDCLLSSAANIVIQPHLLFSGLLIDELRSQVEQRRKENPEKNWILTETLGADGKLAELLANRAKKMLAENALEH